MIHILPLHVCAIEISPAILRHFSRNSTSFGALLFVDIDDVHDVIIFFQAEQNKYLHASFYMNYIPPILIILLNLPYLLPYKGRVAISHRNLTSCSEDIFDCASEFGRRVEENDAISVIFVTNCLSKDPYMKLYFGWILYIFDSSGLPFMYLIMESNSTFKSKLEKDSEQNNLFQLEAALLNIKCKIIVVSMNYFIHPLKLAEARISMGLKPGGFFHMNHEMPWLNMTSDSPSSQFPDETSILKGYQLMDIAIRNYYYEPFSEVSSYLPLGPGHFGYYTGYENFVLDETGEMIVNNTLAHINPEELEYVGEFPEDYAQLPRDINHNNVLLSSRRSILCSLRCRFDYKHASLFHYERDQIKVLLEDNEFPCLVADSANGVISPEVIEDFNALLMATVFTPCPAGTNPETFRHYEVT